MIVTAQASLQILRSAACPRNVGKERVATNNLYKESIMPKSPLNKKTTFLSRLAEITLDDLQKEELSATRERRVLELEKVLEQQAQSTTFSDEKRLDSKGNLVAVCLFESYLAKCVLDNQDTFKNSFLAMITELESIFTTRNFNLTQLLQSKPKHFDLERQLYSIFTCLRVEYPGYDSFESFKELPFNLSACCYLVKLLADKILKPEYSATSSQGMFSGGSDKRSPYSPWRPPQLFSEMNRGVIDIEEEEAPPTKSIGIVEERYQPTELKDYFTNEIYPSMAIYTPKEDSFVAQWLRNRNLPIISGASGSTELLFSRIFNLIEISSEDMNMIIVGQAWDMVAQGHHSFFEAILVAEFFNLGHFPTREVNLLSFYLHWIPLPVLNAPWLEQFLCKDPSVQPITYYNVAATGASPLQQDTPLQSSIPREPATLPTNGSIASFRLA